MRGKIPAIDPMVQKPSAIPVFVQDANEEGHNSDFESKDGFFEHEERDNDDDDSDCNESLGGLLEDVVKQSVELEKAVNSREMVSTVNHTINIYS